MQRARQVGVDGGGREEREQEERGEGGGGEEKYTPVSITFVSPRYGDVYREPALIAVTVDGYDFEREGGYVVVSAGGQQAHIRRIQYPYYLYYTEALLYYKK